MFFPQNYWWDNCEWQVPDGVKYLCERWWELLRDWHCITTYSLPCSYPLSIIEDTADVLEDLQEGRLRSSHQLDSLRDELTEILKTDQVLRQNFPSEVRSTLAQFDNLYDNTPPNPQNRFAELKRRRAECRRAAVSARRLHHRCLRRRVTEADMTWPGLGGILGAELAKELEDAHPSYGRIDRLTVGLLLDCVYRGYNLDYLTTLLDRYLPEANNLRDGFLHVFRRLHSLLRHEYEILFVLTGARSAKIEPSDLKLKTYDVNDLERFKTAGDMGADIDQFRTQIHTADWVIVGLEWSNDPDAGAAAHAARKALQEIVDYLDFQSPTQQFELQPLALVTWKDRDGNRFARLHPDTSIEQPPIPEHEVSINPFWASQLHGLAEAFRWSAVARRERIPEIALLATWFAFEYLAGTLERTPVEGIMEYFPKALALGNIRRRLYYWWRCIQASPGFETHQAKDTIRQRVTFHSGGVNLQGIAELLVEAVRSTPTSDGATVLEITSQSVLLRERTLTEGRLWSNNQLLAQTLQEDAKEIQREFQRFLVIRNKLVHRARIDHPLLGVVSERAKARLYDLLRDLSGQLTKERLRISVDEVLNDYRDTFDELLMDLGAGKLQADTLINRLVLS